MARPVFIPLINTNEREAVLVSLEVQDGQAVQSGQVLAVFETTKSTSDLQAESAGYIKGLRYREGDTALAGEILCYLTDTADEVIPQVVEVSQPTVPQPSGSDGLPLGLRITQPAAALARQLGIDLANLPAGVFVTEKMVRELSSPHPATLNPGQVLIYGAGGHGKTLLELVRAMGVYQVVGFIDDGLPEGASVLGTPVLGGAEKLRQLYDEGVHQAVNAVGGIGSPEARWKVFERLAQAGFSCPAVAHPRAVIEPSARVGAGVQIFAQAYLGSDSQVGFGSIINTGAIVSHDCRIGDYVNISPGAILAGAVHIGDRSLVGMGVTINLEVKVGAGCRIGNGATIKADVPPGTVVRAGTIWPK